MPRKRKRSSWGSVRRSARDTYVLRWWEDAPEGRVRRCETFHGTRREADDRMAEIRVSANRGASPTLAWFWERYYSRDVAKLRSNTQRTFDYQSECHCSKTKADTAVQEVTFDYQSECHCSKTVWHGGYSTRRFDYQSECHCSKTADRSRPPTCWFDYQSECHCSKT